MPACHNYPYLEKSQATENIPFYLMPAAARRKILKQKVKKEGL
jgi:hypothetical protein